MTSRLCLCFLAFGLCSLHAQQNAKGQTSSLVSKGRFFAGLSTDLSFGFTGYERGFILPAQLQPKIGYFIANRLSIGLTYQGTALSPCITPRSLMYHRGLAELNYYFYTRKNLLLYTQTGLAFEYYGMQNYYNQKNMAVSLKLGAGVSWRLKTNPNIGFNLEAAHYMAPGRPALKFPDLSVGMSYFFGRKRSGKTFQGPAHD